MWQQVSSQGNSKFLWTVVKGRWTMPYCTFISQSSKIGLIWGSKICLKKVMFMSRFDIIDCVKNINMSLVTYPIKC